MAQISVVVPIYDVEPYLEECLRSLAAQTHRDFEAILVDDGSTDSSAAIASAFADRDGRFRLFSQPNGGLSRARNLGADLASGEYLAFLDSDDVLPPDAYERLLGTIVRSGSDIATGNVHRLTSTGCMQAPFVAGVFGRTRTRTHVRSFPPLLTDRTAWNKLWRRSFWDDHGLRFPDGRLHEDIPVVLPAHFKARSVDVISAPVYHYRVREGGAPSITQRRHEIRALRDRLAAVEHVHGFIACNESSRQLRRYERSVLAHDFRYHLNLLPEADDAYRALFMEHAMAFLEQAGPRACADLPAADRVKYELVKRGRLEDLVDLVGEAREFMPPRRRGLRYYATYPAAAAPELAVPRSAFRLGRRDQELALTAAIDDVRVEDGRVRLTGHAYVNALGAPWPDSQRLELAAVRRGGRRSVRMRLAPSRLPTAAVRRRDLAPGLRWAGFQASLRPEAFDGPGSWDLFAHGRSGGVHRRRAVFELADLALAGTYDVPAGSERLLQLVLGADGRARIAAPAQWLRIEHHRRIGGSVLELSGPARLDGEAALELRCGERSLQFPLVVRHSRFGVQVPLAELEAGDEWTFSATGATLSLSAELSGAAWRSGGREFTLERTACGAGRIAARPLAARSARATTGAAAPRLLSPSTIGSSAQLGASTQRQGSRT